LDLPALQPFVIIIYYKLFELCANVLTVTLNFIKACLQTLEINIFAKSFAKLFEQLAIFVIFHTFENHKARDAKEYLRLTALNLLLENWILRADALHMLTEGDYLLPVRCINQVVLA
jgi:hypothetical protein